MCRVSEPVHVRRYVSPAVDVGHYYQETPLLPKEGVESGVIAIGFVHNLGDLEGTHWFGAHTNNITRLDSGTSDTKRVKVWWDHQVVTVYVLYLIIVDERSFLLHAKSKEVMCPRSSGGSRRNPRRVIRNNTQRLHSRARPVGVANEITKKQGGPGACVAPDTIRVGPPGSPEKPKNHPNISPWRAGGDMRKTPVS